MKKYLFFIAFLLFSIPSFVRAMENDARDRKEETFAPKLTIKKNNTKRTEERPTGISKIYKLFMIPSFRTSKSPAKNVEKDGNAPTQMPTMIATQSQQTNGNPSSPTSTTDTATEKDLDTWLLNLGINPLQTKNPEIISSEKEKGGSEEEKKRSPKPSIGNFSTMTKTQTSPSLLTQPTAPKPRRWTAGKSGPDNLQEFEAKYTNPKAFLENQERKHEEIRKMQQEQEEEEKNKSELKKLSLEELIQRKKDIEAQLGNEQLQISKEDRTSLFETWLGIDELIKSKKMPTYSERQNQQKLRREKSATGLYLDGKKNSSFLNSSSKEKLSYIYKLNKGEKFLSLNLNVFLQSKEHRITICF